MKRLGSILLVAGCLSGTLQPYAQEYPAGPVSDTPDELSLKARAAARTLLFKEPEPLSLQWLREEVNPLLRARRKLRQAMQVRAEKAAATAVPMVPKRDMSKEVGLWRMSVGNTSADNWSPYPDRALDAAAARLASRQAARQPKSPRQNEAAEKIKKRKNNRQRQWQKKYR
jgi:hypothetical protein